MTMPNKRWVEVRMIVTMSIDVTHAALDEVLKTRVVNPSSLAQVVASEVVSNLESLPFIELAIVTTL